MPEAIEYGENLVVHREAVEATPYLPNVIVSTSPFVRPEDYGIPLDTIDPDLRQVRNVKLPWSRGQEDGQPALEAGLPVLLLDAQEPALDALVVVDGRLALDLERQLRRPVPGRQARPGRRRPPDPDEPARRPPTLGLHEGDYVWVDANPLDRPYVGWDKDAGSFRAQGVPLHGAGRSSTRACPTTSRS